MISTVTIFNTLSDKKTCTIFKTIASTQLNTDILLTHLKLTRKQFYSRIPLLMRGGLVKREKGRYVLTAFGRVIHSAQLDLEAKFQNAVDNYWKLKAIDSLQMPSGEERSNFISELIDIQEIKRDLLNEEPELFTGLVARPIGRSHGLTVETL